LYRRRRRRRIHSIIICCYKVKKTNSKVIANINLNKFTPLSGGIGLGTLNLKCRTS